MKKHTKEKINYMFAEEIITTEIIFYYNLIYLSTIDYRSEFKC